MFIPDSWETPPRSSTGGTRAFIRQRVGLDRQAILELGRNPQAMSVEATFDWIDTLALAAMIEGYRRRGWLHIDRALSIQPQATLAIRLTAQGRLQGDELLRRWL